MPEIKRKFSNGAKVEGDYSNPNRVDPLAERVMKIMKVEVNSFFFVVTGMTLIRRPATAKRLTSMWKKG